MKRERSYRGISLRAAVGYLERLGGEAVDERTVDGDGWRVTLEEQTVSVGATLKLNEVTVTFEGDEEALEPLVEQFSQKAIRAGG